MNIGIMESIDAIQPAERYKIVVLDAKTNKIVLSACKMFDIMDRNVTCKSNRGEKGLEMKTGAPYGYYWIP